MTGTLDDDISSCLTGDTITVYVGPKRKRYSVHEALLTQIEWFRTKILYSKCYLVDRYSISLIAEEPEVFELLIKWLYCKKFQAISITDDEIAKEEVTTCVRLYLKACTWGISELQNALMDRLKARKTCEYGYFPRSLIKEIYENTGPHSPLRSYLVESFIYKGVEWEESTGFLDTTDESHILTRKSALKNQLNAGNHDFVLDCYEALFQLCAKSKIRDPDRRTGCVYHEHEGGGKCGKSGK